MDFYELGEYNISEKLLCRMFNLPDLTDEFEIEILDYGACTFMIWNGAEKYDKGFSDHPLESLGSRKHDGQYELVLPKEFLDFIKKYTPFNYKKEFEKSEPTDYKIICEDVGIIGIQNHFEAIIRLHENLSPNQFNDDKMFEELELLIQRISTAINEDTINKLSDIENNLLLKKEVLQCNT